MTSRITQTHPLSQLKIRKLHNRPMREFSSLRVGGEADIILFPQNREELEEIASVARATEAPIYPVGGGTNLLVRDRGLRGAVVSLSRGFNYVNIEGGESRHVLLKAGAGTSLARVCLIALKNGFKGLEGLMGIPGSLGGCLTMNAGTSSSSIGENINTVEMLTEDGKSISFHRSDITFGYRCATYPSRGVIVEAELMVKRNGGGELRKLALEAAGRRVAARKVFPFNAGSIFKNPPGYSAGALIEECGLKGANEGDAQISHLHGNIIINRRNAKAEDILKLMDRARETVLRRLSIELEHEIRIIGE